MRLALILSLTMLLLGCDQIQLRVGSSDTETEIEIDSLKWEFTAGYNDSEFNTGWLLNKETGELRICKDLSGPVLSNVFKRDCYPLYDPSNPKPQL